MRISDWSSDVCSSDLERDGQDAGARNVGDGAAADHAEQAAGHHRHLRWAAPHLAEGGVGDIGEELRCASRLQHRAKDNEQDDVVGRDGERRSEEHTSELQSLMRISYAVFCLKQTKRSTNTR